MTERQTALQRAADAVDTAIEALGDAETVVADLTISGHSKEYQAAEDAVATWLAALEQINSRLQKEANRQFWKEV